MHMPTARAFLSSAVTSLFLMTSLVVNDVRCWILMAFVVVCYG